MKTLGKVLSERKKIVIVLGAARSGSTLLSKAIGGHSRCFAVGEINRFNQEISNPKTLCGCNELLFECSFWKKVLDSLNLKFGVNNRIENDFEIGVFKQITELNKIHKLIPTILFRRPYRNMEIESAIENSYNLYKVIFDTSGKDVLIDSTKGLFRALIFESLAPKGIEVKFIHLVRDGRGVLNSALKSTYKVVDKDGQFKEFKGTKIINRSGALHTWLYVNIRNFIILKLFRNKKTVFIRYEDFTKNPKTILKGVFDSLELSHEDDAVKLDMHENHIMGGNSSRINAKRINHQDEAWRKDLGRSNLKYFNRRAGLLNKLLGYE